MNETKDSGEANIQDKSDPASHMDVDSGDAEGYVVADQEGNESVIERVTKIDLFKNLEPEQLVEDATVKVVQDVANVDSAAAELTSVSATLYTDGGSENSAKSDAAASSKEVAASSQYPAAVPTVGSKEDDQSLGDDAPKQGMNDT